MRIIKCDENEFSTKCVCGCVVAFAEKEIKTDTSGNFYNAPKYARFIICPQCRRAIYIDNAKVTKLPSEIGTIKETPKFHVGDTKVKTAAQDYAEKSCKCQEEVDAFVGGAVWATKEFAAIVRANISLIDETVQEKVEKLYFEITGEKMYKGYKD